VSEDEDNPVDEAEFEWRGARRGARRPGRPRGSLNTAPIVRDLNAAAAAVPEDQRFPDIAELIRRQLRMVADVQTSFEERLADKKKGLGAREVMDLSGALDKAMAAVSRAARAQEDVLARMSQKQLLESAIRRIEEQDPGVVRFVIRRLRGAIDGRADGTPRTAADAIADLETDE
jgi:hypothetical protein